MKFCSLSSSFACKEVLFARFELRLSPKEVLFAKFELRLWLALINLKERLRFGFELRFQLALISKLSASENDLASDSSFAFGLLSSRNFQPQTAASHKTRTSLTLVLVSVLSAPNHSPLTPHTSHLTPHTSHLTSPPID